MSLFLAIVVFLQYLFYLGVTQHRYVEQQLAPTVMDALLAQGKEVFYFGDSTVFSLCAQEPEAQSLIETLQTNLDGISVGQVAYPAYSLTQYEIFFKYLSRQTRRPKVAVVPVNIRSFTTSWDMRPDWQFQREKIFVDYSGTLYRAFYGPLVIFKAPVFNLNPIEMSDYLEMPVYDGDAVVGRVKDFYIDFDRPRADFNLRDQFIFCYMQSIKPEHRKAKSLQQVIRMANNMGVKLVLYIPPLDYQTGIGYLGDAFETRLHENVQALQSLAAQEGAELLDLSTLLPTENFCPPPFMPNDHINSDGAAIVAERLVEAVRAALDTLPDGTTAAAR